MNESLVETLAYGLDCVREAMEVAERNPRHAELRRVLLEAADKLIKAKAIVMAAASKRKVAA